MGLTSIPGFIEGSYNSRSRGASACRSVNLRIERNKDPLSKTPFTAYPRPGKRLFATMPASPNYGAWANKTRVFVGAGGFLYELLQDGTANLQGAIAVGSNPVTMRANGTQLVVCSAGNVYVATGTVVFQPIINFGSGTVTIAGNVATWVSGDKFTDVDPGNFFMLDTTLYVVSVVTDDEHLTLTAVPPPPPGPDPIPYEVGNEMLTGATVEFIDGYFIVNTPNTKQFRFSNLLNGKKWDAIDNGEKSGSTDNIATVFDLGGQLALIGDTKATEVWADAVSGDNVFVRISGRSMNCGTDAPWSVTKLVDGSLCWLLSSDQGKEEIVRTTGGEPVRISDHALENALRSYSRIDDAIGASYLEDGHSIFRITFPTANRSWEYDATESAAVGHSIWTEIGIATAVDEVYDADPGYYHVHVSWPNGTRMHLSFDFASGDVWEISPDFLDDDGVDYPVMRIGPPKNANLERTACPQFALDCELGTIDPSLFGPDGKPLIPTVSMSFSDDGARTWIDCGAASLGRSGEYEGTFLTDAELSDATPNSQTNPQTFEAKPHWEGLGDFWISRTFKVKSSAKMLRAIYDGLVELAK